MKESIEKLKPYLRHKSICPRIHWQERECQCICGLDETLFLLEKQQEPESGELEGKVKIQDALNGCMLQFRHNEDGSFVITDSNTKTLFCWLVDNRLLLKEKLDLLDRQAKEIFSLQKENNLWKLRVEEAGKMVENLTIDFEKAKKMLEDYENEELAATPTILKLQTENEELKKQSGIKWISVKDKLPEKERTYLVYCENGGYYGISEYERKTKNFWHDYHKTETANVTHYAEINLPENKETK